MGERILQTQALTYRVQGLGEGIGVEGLGVYRVWIYGCRVYGMGFRGLEYRNFTV